jgi:hypothetical protein
MYYRYKVFQEKHEQKDDNIVYFQIFYINQKD